MSIILAPMEGLLDYVLRDILTRAGGVDRCVSEFIRVTNTVLPTKVFTRVVPELLTGGCTHSGVPVRPQLLGSDPACMADNAAKLARLQPLGIDLNFGCPAAVVNRHGGGAALLDDPQLLERIVSSVRLAVPPHIAVSAKMRLGFNDDKRAEECAIAITEGGADELVVHARTKQDGYRPPAYWERIADLRAVTSIPMVANGEIWTVEDAQRCREVSGCHALMLGRGMVANPNLAHAIRAQNIDAPAPTRPEYAKRWATLFPLIESFWMLVGTRVEEKYRAGRLKQWLNYLRKSYPEAEIAYGQLRTARAAAQVGLWLLEERARLMLQRAA